MSQRSFRTFWNQATSSHGSITPHVVPHVLFFGLLAAIICLFSWSFELHFQIAIGIEIGPHEFAGAALTLLLILRTNAGYDRWWEGRRLWGGIVNQSRNLVITALTYGPSDPDWRRRLVQWTSAFPHVARASLRGERTCPRLEALVGPQAAARIEAADHMPSFVAVMLARLLREAREEKKMDDFGFLQADRERALLIDHIGACERILKSPLPLVYAIKIRRFIVIFLLTLPFALLHKIQADWQVPFVTMMVAYPLMSLDQIGVELQNPFITYNLSHLPLDDISSNIERNLAGVLKAEDYADSSIKAETPTVGHDR